jgi:NADH-quinone oxidoreductase subunit G
MVVHTESEEVIKAREGVLEFLLINHPLDCPVCDKGGECDLQDFSFYHGPGKSRFIEEKLKYPKPVPLSDKILLDMERCVLCERCVRYFDEITEEGQLVLLNRGVHTMIGTFNGEPMDSHFQGNIMELCPVGALTSADWRFSARPWDMRSTPSVCHGCSVGCNVQVQSRDDRLVRYMIRENPRIDDGWLCDAGRYGFHFVNGDRRLVHPTMRSGGATVTAAYPDAVAEVASRLQAVVQAHGPQSVGGIASPAATNEELFLFQRWLRQVIGTPNVDHRVDFTAHIPAPADFELAIDEFKTCDAIFVLGDQAAVDLGPILELRLKKARRRRGTRLILERGRSVSRLLEDLPEGAANIGILAPENLAVDAGVLQARLRERGLTARKLHILTHANSRGAADMGCLPELLPGYEAASGRPGMGTWEMLEAAASGRLKALVVMGPTPLSDLQNNPLLHKGLAGLDFLAVLDIMETALSQAAHVVLPLHSFAEKEGTLTNLEGRVQRIRAAIPPVASTPPDWRIMQDLANGWEAGWSYHQPAEIMRDIVGAVPAYGIARAGDRARWWDG